MTLRAQLVALLGAFVAVLGVLAVVVAVAFDGARERDAELNDRLAPAATVVRDLRAAIVDQETGERGFVITGDEVFLEPYQTGQVRQRVLVDRLEGLLAGDRPGMRALAGVEAGVRAWRRVAAEPAIAAVRAGTPARAQALLASGEGRRRFDVVRSRVDGLERVLDAESEAAEADVERADRRLAGALGVAGLVLVLLAIAVAGVLQRSVLVPMLRLRGGLRRVAGGELDAEIAPEGPPEVAALARDAEAMRRRILVELEDARAAHEGLRQRGPVVDALREDLAAGPPAAAPGVVLAGEVRSAEGVLAGDWWDALALPGGGTAVLVVDVSGHGARAGLLAAELKHVLRTALRLGRPLPETLGVAAGALEDPDTFATCVVAVVDPSGTRVTVANAGHPPPVVIPLDGASPRWLAPTGPVLSVLGGTWGEASASLVPGELLVLYTDGLVEARDPDGRPLGEDGVVTILRALGSRTPQAAVDALLGAARDHARARARDDATVVALALEGD